MVMPTNKKALSKVLVKRIVIALKALNEIDADNVGFEMETLTGLHLRIETDGPLGQVSISETRRYGLVESYPTQRQFAMAYNMDPVGLKGHIDK